MNTNPKVLISAPTAQVKDYCFEDWAKNVKSFTYPDFDVQLFDNSKGLDYTARLIKYFPTIHIEPQDNETNRETMLRCQNQMRDYLLNNNYDYLLSLETDIFPPVNCIEYLLSLKKQVCGLPYFVGQAFDSKPMMFDTEDFGMLRLAKPMNIDKSFIYFDGQVKEAYQPGIGCLLIHKDIIKNIPFRVDLQDSAKSHADVYFHTDLKTAGIPVFIDTHIMCRHYNKNWKKLEQYKNL